MPATSGSDRPNPVQAAMTRCRPHFIAAAIFSAVSNVLLLTPSIYMMQVYDRVLPTGGLVTLAALSAVACLGLATLSVLDWLRARLLVRAGARLEHDLAGDTLHIIVARVGLSRLARTEAMRYLDTLRQGVSSPATAALFDVPWTPVYILAAFLLHPALGVLAFFSALLVVALAWHNERRIHKPVYLAGEASNAAYARQSHICNHATEVRSLGLITALTRRQLEERVAVNKLQIQASFIGGDHSSLLRFVRLCLQSGALALGAVLVVDGQMSGGAVFASSLLLTRSLQPVEQLVSGWKSILRSRTAYAKLCELYAGEAPRAHTKLPAPTGAINVERLTVLTPMTNRVALAEINLSVSAGEIIGIVGQSGAGKSTLLRAIAGSVTPARGNVRFDGGSREDWDQEELARHIGYLPQSFILFPGTVKENISRFRGTLGDDPEMLDAAAIEAARGICAHEMIQRLPDGYDTKIGTGGVGLSSGQTQVIAIARALFGKPKILLFDEPTAHLDAQTQHAFAKLLSSARAEGTTILFSTHASDLLASTDKLLLLRDGKIERFGKLADTAPPFRPVSHTPQKAVS